MFGKNYYVIQIQNPHASIPANEFFYIGKNKQLTLGNIKSLTPPDVVFMYLGFTNKRICEQVIAEYKKQYPYFNFQIVTHTVTKSSLKRTKKQQRLTDQQLRENVKFMY